MVNNINNNSRGDQVETIDSLLDRTSHLLAGIQSQIVPRQIENTEKYLRLIRNEQKYLQRLATSNPSARANAGNLVFFEAMYKLICSINDISAIYKDFKYSPASFVIDDREQGGDHQLLQRRKKVPIRVDIVANGGMEWIRVKASKSGLKDQSLDIECSSDSEDSSEDSRQQEEYLPRSLRIAASLVEASKQNLVHYKQPQVVIWLANSPAMGAGDGGEFVEPRAAEILQRLGCRVSFGIDDLSLTFSGGSSGVQPVVGGDPVNSGVETVNFDISGLLALICYCCHHPDEKLHPVAERVPALKTQWLEEQTDPLLEKFRNFLRGSVRLIATQACVDRFWTIVSTLGGVEENRLAHQLFETGLVDIFPNDKDLHELRVEVVADEPSDRFVRLKEILNEQARALKSLSDEQKQSHCQMASTPKLSDIHIDIFGTGDRYRATTVTANKWVAKALKHLDDSAQYHEHFSDISIWSHPSRSLSEQRQNGVESRRSLMHQA